MPALDTNATACVLGGVNIHLGGLVTPNGTSFAAVAGPDPNDTVAAGCCAPYPVHFIPPCLLWCEFGPESPRTPWTACIEAHGVTVHASMILGPPDAFRVSRPPGTPVAAIASVLAIASGLALAFAAVQYTRRKDLAWWRALAARRTLEQELSDRNALHLGGDGSGGGGLPTPAPA